MKKLFLDTLHGPQVSIMSRSSHVLLIILGIGGWIGFFSLLTGQSENVIKPASKISTYENAPHRTFNTRCFDEKRVPDYCYSNVDGVFNQDVSQDDGLVLNYIRHCHLDTPSDKMIKLSHPLRQTSQAKAVDGILQGKRGGFFVECGGLDGERSSNTMWLERKQHWQGVLIEMDPAWYQQLRGKHRKAYSLNVCISPHAYPVKMKFQEHQHGSGKLIMKDDQSEGGVECFPFYSIMMALNRTKIDYFSLDVEGAEWHILQTIPLDKLDISIFTIEFDKITEHLDDLDKYMTKYGYVKHSKIVESIHEILLYTQDLVYVKKEFMDNINNKNNN